MKKDQVAIVGCESYDEELVYNKVKESVDLLGGINEFVKSGQRVALKVNLLMKATPEKSATTHPSVVKAVARLCKENGANVIIVDSAGGPYTQGYMNSIYKASGIEKVAQDLDVELNQNFDYQSIECENAVIGKKFDILKTLYDADCIINLCKLKTHAFTGFTNAVKNMFGAIPGLTKVEMHGKYRDIDTFSEFLYDIHEYFKDKLVLNISDAIIGMEGEGPSNGSPRFIGVIGASTNAIKLDLASLKLINAEPEKMPTILKAVSRNLITDYEFEVVGDNIEKYVVKDYDLVTPNLKKPYANFVPQFLQNFVHNIMTQKPKINQKDCRGCRKCFEHCPVKAISMVKKGNKMVASIDYNKCIRCFCCQELCPFGVIKIKSGIIYRIVHIKSKKRKKQ